LIHLKTLQEIETMQANGRILSVILDKVKHQAKPGVSTLELAEYAHELILESGAKSAFLGYRNFPGVICVSLNDEVVHGIPSSAKVLQYGDLLKLDIGIKRNGFYADMAETVFLGTTPPPEIRKLLQITKMALDAGIRNLLPGNTLGKVSRSIQDVIETGDLSVVKRFVGHGIGRKLHENPPIPNFGTPEEGPRLEIGMVVAIEPIAAYGDPEIAIKQDGWTAMMVSGALSAHFEHTVAITARGPKILTTTCQAG